jgi:hypothetical protein
MRGAVSRELARSSAISTVSWLWGTDASAAKAAFHASRHRNAEALRRKAEARAVTCMSGMGGACEKW